MGGQAQRWYNDSRDISFDSWLNNLVSKTPTGAQTKTQPGMGLGRGRGVRWGEQEASKLDGIGTERERLGVRRTGLVDSAKSAVCGRWSVRCGALFLLHPHGCSPLLP